MGRERERGRENELQRGEGRVAKGMGGEYKRKSKREKRKSKREKRKGGREKVWMTERGAEATYISDGLSISPERVNICCYGHSENNNVWN